MTSIIAAILIVFGAIAGAGGVAYAADGAGPGDPLYGIDQAVEAVRLNLAADPEAEAELLLSFAEERLREAEALPGSENESNRALALSHYGATISALARTLGTVEEVDDTALTGLLDKAFSAQEGRLAHILGQDEGETERDGPDRCVGTDPHPVAKALAESHNVSYDEVMAWFCGGYGLGEIKLALQTSAETGIAPEDLLALKSDAGGWGEVWQELGLIGPSKNKPDGVPHGKPDDAGPPDDAPDGKPDDAEPPDDAPGDKPDKGGRPDGVPRGKPDKAERSDDAPGDKSDKGGRPDGVPRGKPDKSTAPEDEPAEPPVEDPS